MHPKIYLLQKKFLIISIRHLLSDKQKKRFENRTFIGLTQVSRVNTIWGNHPNISNGVTVLVNISHLCLKARLSYVVAWLLQCLQEFLTLPCTMLLCLVRLPFEVAWWSQCLQEYLTPLCATCYPFVEQDFPL